MGFSQFKRFSLYNILFAMIWWILEKIQPKWSSRMLYFGLRGGAFPIVKNMDPVLTSSVMGFSFKSPIGLAAGIDKRGNVLDELIQIGFGFGEFGSYTLEKEMPEKKTFLINRFKAIVVQSDGYRNPGVSVMLPIFAARRHLPSVVGINITSTASNEEENIKMGRKMSYLEEFELLVQRVAPYCDYITLNFANPNTELCSLISDRSMMVPLLKGIKRMIEIAAPLKPPKLVVKVPLDLTPTEVPMVTKMFLETGVDAVIVGGPISLTKNSGFIKSKAIPYTGMLSGLPIQDRSTDLVGKFYQFGKGKLPIIASGGVFTGEDAFKKIAAGASLVQIHSALTFSGPGVIYKMNRDLAKILHQKGFKNISEAVGCDFI